MSTIQGPGWRRNLNCPRRPASRTGATDGIHARASTAVTAAHTASATNASRHDICSASSVPAGTPSMFATVCPVTMDATARASLPLRASSLATCGRPARKRAPTSIGAFTAMALKALPAQAMTMNMTINVRGGILRPNTSISVPTHTPIAYAEMKCPAVGMLTCRVCAVCGSMPIITNSAAPSTNAPAASANNPKPLPPVLPCFPPRSARVAMFVAPVIRAPHLCLRVNPLT